MNADDVERGRRIVEGGKYAPPRGEYLGRIEYWRLDVFEGSPQEWKDALLAEYFEERRRRDGA